MKEAAVEPATKEKKRRKPRCKEKKLLSRILEDSLLGAKVPFALSQTEHAPIVVSTCVYV